MSDAATIEHCAKALAWQAHGVCEEDWGKLSEARRMMIRAEARAVLCAAQEV